MEIAEEISAEWIAWDAEQKEKEAKRALYSKALYVLAGSDSKWISNQRAFNRWDLSQQTKWIRHIEKQAQAGLPMAEELMTRALAVRMGGA